MDYSLPLLGLAEDITYLSLLEYPFESISRLLLYAADHD